MPSLVLPQLTSNIYFAGAIVKYLEQTNLEDLSGDALILLVNIFDDQSIKAASFEFTKKLIDALEFVVDQSTEDALFSLFTVILPYYEKHHPEQNILLDEFLHRE